MTQNIKWTPNKNQKAFMEALEGVEEGLTLSEVNEKLGTEIKTGSINCLLTKGLVEADGEREVMVMTKKKVKVYKLVHKD
jgi:hypothetical protein